MKKRSICAKIGVTRVYVVWFYVMSHNDYQIVHNLLSIHMFDYFLGNGVEQIVRVSMELNQMVSRSSTRNREVSTEPCGGTQAYTLL